MKITGIVFQALSALLLLPIIIILTRDFHANNIVWARTLIPGARTIPLLVLAACASGSVIIALLIKVWSTPTTRWGFFLVLFVTALTAVTFIAISSEYFINEYNLVMMLTFLIITLLLGIITVIENLSTRNLAMNVISTKEIMFRQIFGTVVTLLLLIVLGFIAIMYVGFMGG